MSSKNQYSATRHAHHLVVADKLTLALEHLDLDSVLAIGSGRERLGLLGGDRSVAVDQAGEDTTEGLDTEREGGNVEKKDVGDRAGKNTTLDGGTDGDGLVRVDTLRGVAAKESLDGLRNARHTRHTTDKDDVLDLARLHVGVSESLLARVDSSLDEAGSELFELSPAKLHVYVLGARGVGSDEGKVNIGLRSGRQLDLGLLRSLTDTLDSHPVLRKVDSALLLELSDNEVHERNVEVLTTEVGVTVRRLDLEHTLGHLENRDIESASSQVVDSNHPAVRAVKTIGKSSSRRLVDDTTNVKTSDSTSVLCRLTLGVVEVCRHSDD
jgi:hypothetical protein